MYYKFNVLGLAHENGSAPEAGQKPRLTFSDVPTRGCLCGTKHLTRGRTTYLNLFLLNLLGYTNIFGSIFILHNDLQIY